MNELELLFPDHDCAVEPAGPMTVARAHRLAQLHVDVPGGAQCRQRQAALLYLRDEGLIRPDSCRPS